MRSASFEWNAPLAPYSNSGMPEEIQPDFVQVLMALAEANVDFVVIGGLALGVHGADRVTFDADFSHSRSRENVKAIAKALAPFHPRPVGLDPELPFVWDDQMLQGMTPLTLETDIGRIDFLAEPDGAPPYEVMKERALKIPFRGHTIRVASIDDLIAMKKAAGRKTSEMSQPSNRSRSCWRMSPINNAERSDQPPTPRR